DPPTAWSKKGPENRHPPPVPRIPGTFVGFLPLLQDLMVSDYDIPVGFVYASAQAFRRRKLGTLVDRARLGAIRYQRASPDVAVRRLSGRPILSDRLVFLARRRGPRRRRTTRCDLGRERRRRTERRDRQPQVARAGPGARLTRRRDSRCAWQ